MLPKISTDRKHRPPDRQLFGRTLGANERTEAPLAIEDKRRQPWLTLLYAVLFLVMAAGLLAYDFVPAYER